MDRAGPNGAGHDVLAAAELAILVHRGPVIQTILFLILLFVHLAQRLQGHGFTTDALVKVGQLADRLFALLLKEKAHSFNK